MKVNVRMVLVIFFIAIVLFIFLCICTNILNNCLNWCLSPQAMQGLFSGYVAIIVTCLGLGAYESVRKKSDLNKSIICYKNRVSTNMFAEFANISKREITILTIHLKYVVELLEHPNVHDSIIIQKPNISIYAIDPDSNNDILDELRVYYSKEDSEKMKSSMKSKLIDCQESCKKLADSGINIKLNLLKINNPTPIPPFQYYSINNYIFINPLTTIHIPKQDSVPEGWASTKQTPRDTFHIRFDISNDEVKKIVSDYNITLEYYKTECAKK